MYGDIKKGVLSAETDNRGRKVVDTAELERVYGSLETPNTNGKSNGTKRTGADSNGIPEGTERTEPNGQNRTGAEHRTETPARLMFSRLRSIF